MFCDSDFTGEREDRISISGYAILLNDNILSWKSKKQGIVALSSFEAELVALVSGVEQAVYLFEVLEFLGCKLEPKINVFCDNQAAIHVFKQTETTKRSKFIDIRFLRLKERLKSRVNLNYVCSEDNIADMLTKVVSTATFKRLSPRLVM